MSRPMMFLIILVLLLAGGAFYLSSSVREVPTQTIEDDVSRDPANR